MEKVIQERERIRKRAVEYVRKWARNIDFPATIIIIGSYARGDHNFWSDIDVILVANTNRPPHRRLENLEYPPNLEIIFLTPQEFELLLKKREPMAIEALQHGIIIRDSLGIERLKKKYFGELEDSIQNEHNEESY